jgi:hypothetical protein
MRRKNQTYTPAEEPAPRRSRNNWPLLIATLAMLGIAIYLMTKINEESPLKVPPVPFVTPAAETARLEQTINSPSEEVSSAPNMNLEEPAPLATAVVEEKGPREDALEVLLYEQLPGSLAERGIFNWVVDDTHFSDDRTQAMIMMAEKDPESEELLSNEPHIILALYDSSSNKWSLHFNNDPDFPNYLTQSFFANTELMDRYDPAIDKLPMPKAGTVYTGYRLPWRGGLTKRLTWSIGHTSCAGNSCYYAFDFADGTMFELLAAKGGYVYHYKDSCPNGASWCTNSITLEDRSTTPWTYQIYLHIAQNSIPDALRVKGTYVWQGMKIANVDNTGYSTGHHVHFMVVESNTLSCKNYCFGRSVDITFEDVSIFGGRPRRADELRGGQTYYTSGNTFREGPWSNFVPGIFR